MCLIWINPIKKILQPSPGKLKDAIYELNSYVVYNNLLQKRVTESTYNVSLVAILNPELQRIRNWIF